jgi:hypothetical protein
MSDFIVFQKRIRALQYCIAKCKCGKGAEAVKEVVSEGQKIISQEIINLHCQHCGLRFNAAGWYKRNQPDIIDQIKRAKF